MWSYASTAWTDQQFSVWRTLVTLSDDGRPESFFLTFGHAPTAQEIADAAAQLVARMNATGATGELATAIDNGVMPTLRYQTKAQMAALFRSTFRGATRIDAAKMAYWLVERVLAGDITQAQLQNVFDLTPAQYAAFSSRMQAMHDAYLAAAVNAQGE